MQNQGRARRAMVYDDALGRVKEVRVRILVQSFYDIETDGGTILRMHDGPFGMKVSSN